MILFNNKEADLKHKETYRENIKFKFDGSALLLKRNKNGKIKKLLRIVSGYKLKKNGNYELILNDDYLIHFCLKKRIFILLFLLGIILFIPFYFGFSSQKFSYTPNDNIYIFSTTDVGFKSINLIDSYNKSTVVNEKIAPGTTGNFSIIINNNTNYDYKYKFTFNENNLKPEGLYFKFKGSKYYNIKDLISKLNGSLKAHKKTNLEIEWCWDYQGDDIKDTLDGTLALDYSFEISLVSTKL